VLCIFINAIFTRVIANAHKKEPNKDKRTVAMYQLILGLFKNAVAWFIINHIVGKFSISTTHSNVLSNHPEWKKRALTDIDAFNSAIQTRFFKKIIAKFLIISDTERAS
jgi:hypothetical protein